MPVEIKSLSRGDRLAGELRVYERSERNTSTGDPFVILTLGNRSGTIETAPVWSDKLEWADGATPGKIVQVIGDVAFYDNGRGGPPRKQLVLIGPIRVLPDSLFRPEVFLPAIEGDRERLWTWIDRNRAELDSKALSRVLDLFFRDDDFRVRFEQAPASTQGHHAQLGGLLQHVVEVTNIARQIARTIGKRVNADLVVAGALLHDVGKVEAYAIGAEGFTATTPGLLLGHVALGCLMLERRAASAVASGGAPVCTDGQLLELQHMILSHHGALEFGSPVQPMTAEAEIVHWADEASAKATDMIDVLEDPELFGGGHEYTDRPHRRVGRRVWRRPYGWA